MEKGRFYGYCKPSYVNGYEQYLERDINFDYLQAYEGVCRQDLKPIRLAKDLANTLVTSSVAN